LLVGLRFVSEEKPLRCKLAIKALVFGVRHPQRPFKTLHCLGAKVLSQCFRLGRRMHKAVPLACGLKMPQSDSDNPRLGCWGRCGSRLPTWLGPRVSKGGVGNPGPGSLLGVVSSLELALRAVSGHLVRSRSFDA